MSLFILPFLQVRDDNDDPVSGALAHFYVTGTSTAADTYTTAALSVARSWPVAADSNGFLPNIFLNPAVTYKLVVTDSGGDLNNPLFTVDPYTGGLAADIAADAESTETYTYVAADKGKLKQRTYAGDMTDTLPTAASAGNGWWCYIWNDNSTDTVITVSVSGGGTIEGGSTLKIPSGCKARVISTGSKYIAIMTGAGFPLTIGQRMLTLPAGSFYEAATNGCGAVTRAESSTNKVNYLYRSFAYDAEKFAFAEIATPISYLGDGMYARFTWTVASGSAGDTLRWSIQSQVLNDDDPIDSAWPTAATVDDTVHAAGDIHRTAWVSFTPRLGTDNDAPMMIRVSRPVSGTHAAAALLLSVELRIPLVRGNDDNL